MLRTAAFTLIALLFCAATAFGGPAGKITGEQPWRIRFLEAAVVEGDIVRLGEVAVPAGPMDPELWKELAGRSLWPSPPAGKAVNMTRPRLQEAVVRTMPDLAPYCLFAGSLALQRGGAVLGREAIQEEVVKALTPLTAGLGGEVTFSDFRLPSFVFLEHPGQTLSVEPPRKLNAGRISVRLMVNELDGRNVQKLTGSVFADCWTEAPCAALPLNRDEVLQPDGIAHTRVNLAHLRSGVWDGRGGPWRILRPIGVGEVIYQSDLGHIPTVRKGSLVSIVYEGSTVSLTVQGEAMGDGVTGESIPVRNVQSKKQVFAVVRDASTVVIKPAGR